MSAFQGAAGLIRRGFASKIGVGVEIGSVQGAVATWSVISLRYLLTILTPMIDQVATAPCTDPISRMISNFASLPRRSWCYHAALLQSLLNVATSVNAPS